MSHRKCSTALRAVTKGPATKGPANHGTAKHGTANHGTANHGTANHGTECRATLGSFLAIFVFVFYLLAVPGDLFAQQEFRVPIREALRVPIQDLIQDVEVLGLQPGFPVEAANSKPQLLKQTRGLIQNELSIIGDLCELDQKQQQSLVDLAEGEWRAKTNASIIKRTQEHVYGMIDLDSLAERVTRTWLEAVATADQLAKYDAELAERMKWRQKAVISKVLDTLEAKLNLSGIQMEQIEEILNEKWKDRWYRSLEATFDNSSLLPEIRPSWITPILSDSQKAALVTRDPQTRFGSPQVSQDSPMLPIDQRFQVGATTSSESIEIESGAKKASPVDGIIERAKAKDEEGQVDAKKP